MEKTQTQLAIKRQRRSQHRKAKIINCPQCPKKFSTLQGLGQHQAEKHSTSELHNGEGKKTKENSHSWTIIPPNKHEEHLSLLLQECHPVDGLPKMYRVKAYSKKEIDELSICKRCRGKKQFVEGKPCLHHPMKLTQNMLIEAKIKKEKPIYSCCKTSDKGCVKLDSHNYAPPRDKLAVRLHKCAVTPSQQDKADVRAAIALDCEMVGTVVGNYPVSISAVDYLTGEVLIDAYVVPSERVQDWRTWCTGITPEVVSRAAAEGKAFQGWEAAREGLWSYMSPDTVLVGHSLANDLNVLGMIHFRIVDMEIMTRQAVGPECKRSWALKKLSEAFLGLNIQNGQGSHNSLEDAFATREVVLWSTTHREEFAAWARDRNVELREERLKIELEKEERKKKKLEALTCKEEDPGIVVEANYTSIPHTQQVSVIIEVSDSEESYEDEDDSPN